MKVCNVPGCPELVDGSSRCEAHRRAHERRRGTRQQRGYDAAHDRLRARWAPRVATGQVYCWRCTKRIGVLERWHLGHCDDDRGTYHGPEHEACNTATSSHGRCPHPSHAV